MNEELLKYKDELIFVRNFRYDINNKEEFNSVRLDEVFDGPLETGIGNMLYGLAYFKTYEWLEKHESEEGVYSGFLNLDKGLIQLFEEGTREFKEINQFIESTDGIRVWGV